MSPTQTPSFPSRLPTVGTTVFTVMSALATEHQAINLGQGFPDFPCDRNLIAKVNEAMLTDHNQYPPMGYQNYETVLHKKFRIYMAIPTILILKSQLLLVALKAF
jgi:methionine transaminase